MLIIFSYRGSPKSKKLQACSKTWIRGWSRQKAKLISVFFIAGGSVYLCKIPLKENRSFPAPVKLEN